MSDASQRRAGGDRQLGRQAVFLDAKRVIAGDGKFLGAAGKDVVAGTAFEWLRATSDNLP